jgi:hypothetical protein
MAYSTVEAVEECSIFFLDEPATAKRTRFLAVTTYRTPTVSFVRVTVLDLEPVKAYG